MNWGRPYTYQSYIQVLKAFLGPFSERDVRIHLHIAITPHSNTQKYQRQQTLNSNTAKQSKHRITTLSP